MNALSATPWPACPVSLSWPAVPPGASGVDWTTLLDGTEGLDNFDRVGEANWQQADGAIQADAGRQGPGLSGDEQLLPGLRAARRVLGQRRRQQRHLLALPGPAKITDESCYEANIFDQRPDPTYGTGAIVKVAKVGPMPKAGGKWNTYEITLKGAAASSSS